MKTSISRRHMLGGLALASFGVGRLAHGAVDAVRAPATVYFDSPGSVMTALVKMRGHLEGKPTFIWLRGVQYTLIDGEAVPMCGYLGGAITRYRRLGDDTFEFVMYEISYYTDLETGKQLETVRMPVTGREVAVPLYRTGPGQHVIMMENEEELYWSKELTTSAEVARQLAPDARIHYRFNVRQPDVFRDSAWIRNDSFTRMIPDDPDQPGLFYKEAITYQASLAQLADPDAPQVDTSMSFAIATAWRPWMQMQGINGHTMTDGVGGKVFDIHDMPDDFVALTAQLHPDVLENPVALLGD